MFLFLCREYDGRIRRRKYISCNIICIGTCFEYVNCRGLLTGCTVLSPRVTIVLFLFLSSVSVLYIPNIYNNYYTYVAQKKKKRIKIKNCHTAASGRKWQLAEVTIYIPLIPERPTHAWRGATTTATAATTTVSLGIRARRSKNNTLR